MDTQNVVLDTLTKSGEPLKSGDIAKKTGIDKVEVDKAIKQLVKQGKIDSPIRCFYGIKK
jgi:predicted transcriptional regulator